MGYFVMFEEETGMELNPYALNDVQKKSANKDNTIYVCKCCYPEKELKYHFSSDLRLIPCHPQFSRQHDGSCRKNEDYQKRMAYQEKTRLKNQYAEENEDKFVFLTWYPKTESEETLINRLIRCIEDIRKSAYT